MSKNLCSTKVEFILSSRNPVLCLVLNRLLCWQQCICSQRGCTNKCTTAARSTAMIRLQTKHRPDPQLSHPSV